MIIHFQTYNNHINAGKYISNIMGERTLFQPLCSKTYMQVDNSRIVKKLEKTICWRCGGTQNVFGKKVFKCPACKYRLNYDNAFKEKINETRKDYK